MADTAFDIRHDAAGQKFSVTRQGQEAHLLYRRQGTTLDFYSTFVPEAFRGQGLAEQLCRAGFEYAKANQFKVVPSCPYISGAYLKRHPEYLPLTA